MDYMESLELLSRSYTNAQISAQTGVPESTLSYVMRGERALPEKYNESVKSAGYFRAYQELRNEGAGNNSALIISGEPLKSIDDALYTYQQVTESYAKNWLERNKRAQFIEEEGKLVYYNLDKAMDKWAKIMSGWDVTKEDLVKASYESKYYDGKWVSPRG